MWQKPSILKTNFPFNKLTELPAKMRTQKYNILTINELPKPATIPNLVSDGRNEQVTTLTEYIQV